MEEQSVAYCAARGGWHRPGWARPPTRISRAPCSRVWRPGATRTAGWPAGSGWSSAGWDHPGPELKWWAHSPHGLQSCTYAIWCPWVQPMGKKKEGKSHWITSWFSYIHCLFNFHWLIPQFKLKNLPIHAFSFIPLQGKKILEAALNKRGLLLHWGFHHNLTHFYSIHFQQLHSISNLIVILLACYKLETKKTKREKG